MATRPACLHESGGAYARSMTAHFDAAVVGSGPNGLAAAITLARAGRSVVVLEANEAIGGAARSSELIEPGVTHDIASAIHPMVMASPFFTEITNELKRHGLRWVVPPAAAAHPLDDGGAAVAWNDLDRTVEGLGIDGPAYRRFYQPWVDNSDALLDLALNPIVRVPKKPLFSARFAATAAIPARTLARRLWETDEAQALWAGHVGHSILPLTAPFTSSFGIMFTTLAHSVGWGFPEGGAGRIVDAMAELLLELGGEIRTGHRVGSLDDIPPADATILSLSPHQVDDIAGDTFRPSFRKQLQGWKYGAGAWKVDYVLDEPIPWRNPEVAQAGTVHLGGTLDEINRAETAVADGQLTDTPFVLLAQHTNFDTTRAPEGTHTVWAYCHVPNGCTVDRTEAIESQIERFAPGFKDTIRGRHATSPQDLQTQNANLVGGDIGGGSYAGRQLFLRPRPHPRPFDTPDPRLFIGSASTTPGAGVHGMAGRGAALRALKTTLA